VLERTLADPRVRFLGNVTYGVDLHHRDLPVDLDCERAVVVGNGSVAMDVTRMLVRSADELA